jgi:hypothetical protein
MGDDVDELLGEIAKRYSISFDRFDFSLYFPDETEAGWAWLKSKFGWHDTRRLPITVEHLLAVINRGKWFPPNSGIGF